jgi:hypothetical protein
MRSSVVSLALLAPLYVRSARPIEKYRECVLAWVRRRKLMQTLQAFRFSCLPRGLKLP